MLDETKKLESAIRNAENLHGHLGPFLVIGVRMGIVAERILNPSTSGDGRLQVTARTPLSTPFSCVIDGIQSTTRCTAGNQKLKIEDSHGEIAGCFRLRESPETLDIRVNPKVVQRLMSTLSKETSVEEIAWEIAHMPEEQLFEVEKRIK